MKRALLIAITAASLGLGGRLLAAEAAAKPDCTEKQKAYDDAKAAAKTASKPDLSTCKEKKGKDKAECEKPMKDKAKDDAKAAKDKETTAKEALACCKNPKKKGCTP
jgi:hypothetical protein